jgi:hypothetical protein
MNEPTPVQEPVIELYPVANSPGYILVKWDKSHPKFNDYIALARSLKNQTKSPGWTPHLSGWLYNASAIDLTLKTFKEFKVGRGVKAKATQVAQVEEETCQAAGRITVQGNKLLVTWMPNKKMFETYLTITRNVKLSFQGVYNKTVGGWLFTPLAAKMLVDAFKVHHFYVSPEVKALAGIKDEVTDESYARDMENAANAMLEEDFNGQ